MTEPREHSSEGSTGAFCTVTYVEASPRSEREAARLLAGYRDAGPVAVGAQHLDVIQRVDRPGQFVVLAVWPEQRAYEEHRAGEHFQRLDAQLAALLIAPNDTRQHGALAVGELIAGETASVTVVTHVDVVPPEKDNAVVALERLARESRQHAGNVLFDIWQQTNRLNHFTVVEGWASRSALDEHKMASQTRAFRTSLSTMTGALYDDRWYTALR
jgi:quinol monooxygenase YgiN